jgi:hypothetical protein
MLDISKLEGGSKFACASCGAILVVGEATAVKKSLKESGPAFTPKGKAEAPAPAPSRRRAAEEGAERPSRRAAEPVPKSRLPIFIGAGVLAVVAVVAIVLSGRGGGGGTGGATGTTALDWWARQGSRLSTASAEELRAMLAEGRAKGYDRDAAFWADKEAQVQAALVKKDPTDDTANKRVGNKNLRDYPDFDKVWARMQENFKRLPPEMQDFVDALEVVEGKPVWMTPAKYAEAGKKLDEFVAWQGKLDENPAAGAIESFTREAKTRLSSSQRKLGFGAVAEGPFVILFGYEENADVEATRGQLLGEGKKWSAALRLLREEFDKRIREPLGLPAIEAGKYYCDLVVPTADDLRKLVREGEGLDATGDIPGYFSPTTRWAQLREPKEANEKALFGGDLAHEAAHQLQWHFSADPKQKLLNYMAEWNGIWLTEGLAEYLGGGIDLDPASGKASFSGQPPRRVEFLRGMRDNGVPLIPLRELVQLRPDNFEPYIGRTWHDTLRESEDLPEAAIAWLGTQEAMAQKILYAQSWLLTHFLYEAEGGKYRAQLMDLVLTALRGGVKPDRYRKEAGIAERFGSAFDAFVEIMGLKDDASWKALQEAHDRHARSLRGE